MTCLCQAVHTSGVLSFRCSLYCTAGFCGMDCFMHARLERLAWITYPYHHTPRRNAAIPLKDDAPKNPPIVVNSGTGTVWERWEHQCNWNRGCLVSHLARCKVKKNTVYTFCLCVLIFLSIFILLIRQQIAQITQVVLNSSRSLTYYLDARKTLPSPPSCWGAHPWNKGQTWSKSTTQ